MNQPATLDNKTVPANGHVLIPPHGLKGGLAPEQLVGPRALVILGALILLCIVVIIGVTRLYTLFKNSRRKNLLKSDGAVTGNAISLLTQLNGVALPSENYASDHERWSDWARFSSEVSIILRRAVEYRTKLPVAERTTKEIQGLFEASDLIFTTSSKHELVDILNRLDEITFASRIVSVSHASDLLGRVKAIVNKLTEDDLRSGDRLPSEDIKVKIFE